MNFLDDGTENVEYEYINRTILDDNVLNMSLIILKVNYVTIDADNAPCQGYYIIRFSSFSYTVQEDINIDGQVLSSSEMVFEGTYFSQ